MLSFRVKIKTRKDVLITSYKLSLTVRFSKPEFYVTLVFPC